ncbi:32734_t:CDS:2 [Gigaspora margarita]|uniref:32734_t:CDS:1 n=1 Tax=Gigaspora margarita TaxID=4874 RepID=A0ABN7VR09_GIGMA|nr:32734_t:CDS:2 [Gigaspora margarita]
MQKKATALEGLYIIEDFITETEEQELIRAVDSRAWCGNVVEINLFFLTSNGKNEIDICETTESPNPELKRRTQHYGYEFSYRYRKVIQNLGPLPTFTDFITKRFKQQKIIEFEDEPNMCIINEYEAGQAPRSLLIMTKSSRYDYKHSISKDIIEWFEEGENGEKREIVRSRRVSLTFRTMCNFGADVATNS